MRYGRNARTRLPDSEEFASGATAGLSKGPRLRGRTTPSAQREGKDSSCSINERALQVATAPELIPLGLPAAEANITIIEGVIRGIAAIVKLFWRIAKTRRRQLDRAIP